MPEIGKSDGNGHSHVFHTVPGVITELSLSSVLGVKSTVSLHLNIESVEVDSKYYFRVATGNPVFIVHPVHSGLFKVGF